MGTPLCEILSDTGNDVIVTSRRKRVAKKSNIRYVEGNAKDLIFLKNFFSSERFDVIVDFMSYTTDEFRQRVDILLDSTDHYIFISSARVFAESKDLINEYSPRVLDTTTDRKYLESDDYGLAKARQEDILRSMTRQNYTIIRPSLIYGKTRLQLGAFDKEHWLYRVLKGRSIVFSYDMEDKLTSMTSGFDAASSIVAIAGNRNTFGKIFNVADGVSYTWGQILTIYLDALEAITGERPKVVMTAKTIRLYDKKARTQILNARGIDRCFDNRAIMALTRKPFITPQEGLPVALKEFLLNPTFLYVDYRLEALSDRAAGEYTPLHEIPSLGKKFMYLCYRYRFVWLFEFVSKLKSISYLLYHNIYGRGKN